MGRGAFGLQGRCHIDYDGRRFGYGSFLDGDSGQLAKEHARPQSTLGPVAAILACARQSARMGQDPSPARNTASQYRAMWQKKAGERARLTPALLNGYGTNKPLNRSKEQHESVLITNRGVAARRVAWQAEVHRGWRIGSVANGGYVLALVGRALSEALNQPDPLSINAFYLAPVALGEVEVAVESLSETRSTHFASADLRQDGQLKLRATAAYTDLDRLSGPDWTNVAPPEVPAFDEVAAPAMSHLEIHQSIDLRMVQGADVFTEGKTNDTGEFIAWLAHSRRRCSRGPLIS